MKKHSQASPPSSGGFFFPHGGTAASFSKYSPHYFLMFLAVAVLFMALIPSTAAHQLQASSTCGSFSTCGECVSTAEANCAWCSLANACVGEETDCPIGLDEVMVDRETNAIFDKCRFGALRVTGSNDTYCSRISFSSAGPLDAKFSMRTGDFAVMSNLLDRNDTSILEEVDYNVTAIGVHFVTSGKDAAIRVVRSPGIDDMNTIFFIVGTPSAKYRVGQVIAITMAGEEEVECGYIHSQDITLTTYYEMLYNAGTWGNVVMLAVMSTVLLVTTLCCSCKFAEPEPPQLQSKKSKSANQKVTEVNETSNEQQVTAPSAEEKDMMINQSKGAAVILNDRQFHVLPSVNNKLINQALAMFFAPTSTVVKNLGLPSVVYFRFYAIIFAVMLVYTVLACAILLPIYVTSDKFAYFADIATTTAATIIDNISSWQGAIYCIVTAVFYLIAVVTVGLLYWLSRTVAAATKKPQRTTVMINHGGASGVKATELEEHLKQVFGEQAVDNLYLAFDSKGQPMSTSFVTFTTEEAVNQCLARYSKKKTEPEQLGSLNEVGWKASIAPEADDIQWDNLSVSIKSRIARTIFGLIVIAILMLLSFAAVLAASTWITIIKTLSTGSYVKEQNMDLAIGVKLAEFLSFNLVPTLISSVSLLVMPVIKAIAAFEKHPTHSGQKRAAMRYMLGYVFFNTIVIPFIAEEVLFRYTATKVAEAGLEAEVNYLNNVAIKSIMLVVGQTFTSRAIPLLLMSLSIVFQVVFKKKFARPPFYYEYNYALKLMVLAMVLLFGPLVPVICFYGLLYLTITYLVDRFTIMYVHAKEPVHSSSSFLDTIASSFGLLVLTPCLPFLILFMSPVLYSDAIYIYLGVLAIVVFLLVLLVIGFNWLIMKRLSLVHLVVVVPASNDLYKCPYQPEEVEIKSTSV